MNLNRTHNSDAILSCCSLEVFASVGMLARAKGNGPRRNELWSAKGAERISAMIDLIDSAAGT